MRHLTVSMPDYLAAEINTVAAGDVSGWLAAAARGRLAEELAAGRAELSGPAVRAVLADEGRQQFEADFRDALVDTTRDFDVDRLVEVVRVWWLKAGGAVEVVDKDRARAAHAASLATNEYGGDPRPLYVLPVVVNQTGPAVREALDEPARVEFEVQFERELVAAAASFDHRPVQLLVRHWWGAASMHANPEERERDRETMRRVAVGDPTVFGTSPHRSQPAA